MGIDVGVLRCSAGDAWVSMDLAIRSLTAASPHHFSSSTTPEQGNVYIDMTRAMHHSAGLGRPGSPLALKKKHLLLHKLVP